MEDHKEIYLQPECCADTDTGRLWCEHNSPEDCEDGKAWTRYIRADFVKPQLEAFERLIDFDTVNILKSAEEIAELKRKLKDKENEVHDLLSELSLASVFNTNPDPIKKMTEEIKLYRPANGTEAMNFIGNNCTFCKKNNKADDYCGIQSRSMFYKITHKDYPTEWRYVDGKPTCTAREMISNGNQEKESLTQDQ